MSLTGKVVFVTGGGSGIGKAAAVLLAQRVARVAVLSNTADEIEKTVLEMKSSGYEGMSVTANVARENELGSAIQQVVERWGRIGILT